MFRRVRPRHCDPAADIGNVLSLRADCAQGCVKHHRVIASLLPTFDTVRKLRLQLCSTARLRSNTAGVLAGAQDGQMREPISGIKTKRALSACNHAMVLEKAERSRA